MFEKLGIVFWIALYFVVKWAVKNGIKEAYKDITGKDTAEEMEVEEMEVEEMEVEEMEVEEMEAVDMEAKEMCKELDLNEEEE